MSGAGLNDYASSRNFTRHKIHIGIDVRLVRKFAVGVAATDLPFRAGRVEPLKRMDSDIRMGTVANSAEFDAWGLPKEAESSGLQTLRSNRALGHRLRGS